MHADPLSRPLPDRPARGRWILVALVVVAALAVLAYLALVREADAPAPLASAPAEPPPAAAEPPAAPAVRYPIERAQVDASAADALPSLNASDEPLLAALAHALAGSPLERVLVREGLVRRFVATVDNIPRAKVPLGVRSVQPTPGLVAIVEADGRKSLAAGNTPRYADLMRVVDAVEPRALVALYVRHYPLFQQAYRELGYPQGEFNDRLVDAIDSLLATPDVEGPLALLQPNVLYTFADPALESLPAGQKALLRVGPANAARIKARLAEIRALLVP